jgi:hypothetical protein
LLSYTPIPWRRRGDFGEFENNPANRLFTLDKLPLAVWFGAAF